METWIQNPATNCPHLDTLRDAIEFKKLNNGLLKPSIVEELIGDIYARIYESNADDLRAKETAEENRVRMRLDNILAGPMPESVAYDALSIAMPDQQAADPMAIYKRKPTTITHREVIRKAEGLMVKPPPIATPKPATRALASTSEPGKSPGIAIVIPVHIPSKEVTSVPDTPGSVHDSADDESELSDVEDDGFDEDNKVEASEDPRAKASLFPNLFGVKANDLGGDGAADGPDVGQDSNGDEEESRTGGTPREATHEAEA